MAAWGLGFLHRLRGELEIAEEHLGRAFRLAGEWKIEWWLAHIGWLWGHVKALRGHGEGVSIVREALERFEARGFGPFRSLLMMNLGEGLLATGGVDEARAIGLKALERARTHGERGHEAWVLRLLGDVATRSGADPSSVHGRYHASMAIAKEVGMRPLVAHCHLGLGKLYRRAGDGAKAQEHLTTAATMYREMDMTFWLEKADAELGGVER
jgi:tetratricopeptide (TPR) repeat protein